MNKNKAINASVVLLGLVSLFADIASEMLYPITPIFLSQVLGTSMAYVGLIEGLAEATSSFLKAPVGHWSDKLKKRKIFILIGYILSALAKPLIGVSVNWLDVLGARSLDRIGKGLRTAPRDALLAESVELKFRGEAFGVHRALDTLGATIGPLFCLFLIGWTATNVSESQMRNLYIWSILPGAFSILLILFLKDQTTQSSTSTKVTSFNLISLYRDLDPQFKKFALSWTIFAIANSSDAFLIMRMKSQGIAFYQIILIYCMYNLVYAFTSPYLGKLSDQISRRSVLLFGLAVYIAVYLGFAWSDQLWQFIGLFVLYGVYMGATMGVAKAFAVDLSDPNKKASSIGFLAGLEGLGTILASLVGGLLWDHISPQSTFIYAAIGAFVSILLLFQISGTRKQEV